MNGLRTRMIKVIDAKEEIIQTLLEDVKNNDKLTRITEKEIRNLHKEFFHSSYIEFA